MYQILLDFYDKLQRSRNVNARAFCKLIRECSVTWKVIESNEQELEQSNAKSRS